MEKILTKYFLNCVILSVRESNSKNLNKMPRLNKDQRVWICLEFGRTNNAHEVSRRWHRRWPNDQAPTIRTILKTFSKFVNEGTCLNVNKGRSGRLRTARTPEIIEQVRNSLNADGLRSSRRNGLQLTRSSFLRIVHLDIKFHPYVLIRRQKLKQDDPAQRLLFCNRLIQTLAAEPNFLDNLITSDEAIFSLNSEVNTRNVVCYAERGDGHPEDHYVEFSQGADKIMVWVGLTRQGVVLGPHFIEGRMNTQEYLRIIRYSVIQREFRQNNINRAVTWWQQDGAPAHTSNASIRYLRGQFPNRLMGKNGDWPWPPRSPDLAICDFFLWGYLKHKIWNVPVNQQPQNLLQLRQSIQRECNNLDRQMIQRAFDGMVSRTRLCIDQRGRAFRNE